jgi:hypothetical protein
MKDKTIAKMFALAVVIFGQRHPAASEFINWASAQNDMLVNIWGTRFEILTGHDLELLHLRFVRHQIALQPLD